MPSTEEKLGYFVKGMREYQRINNIEKQCVINSLLLRDILFTICSLVEISACFAFYKREDGTGILVVHMIVILDGDTDIDPSYEIFSKEDVRYFRTIGEITSAFSETQFRLEREWITKFLEFVKKAEELNNNFKLFLDDEHSKNYYYEQRKFATKYVEDQLNIKLFM